MAEAAQESEAVGVLNHDHQCTRQARMASVTTVFHYAALSRDLHDEATRVRRAGAVFLHDQTPRPTIPAGRCNGQRPTAL